MTNPHVPTGCSATVNTSRQPRAAFGARPEAPRQRPHARAPLPQPTHLVDDQPTGARVVLGLKEERHLDFLHGGLRDSVPYEVRAKNVTCADR